MLSLLVSSFAQIIAASARRRTDALSGCSSSHRSVVQSLFSRPPLLFSLASPPLSLRIGSAVQNHSTESVLQWNNPFCKNGYSAKPFLRNIIQGGHERYSKAGEAHGGVGGKHSIKFEQEIEFGGGYIKHLSGFANQTSLVETPYRCDNAKFFDVETVKVHLYSRGFIPNYDQWSSHGKPLHYTEECQIGGAMEERVEAENEEMVDGDHVERVDVNLTDPYRTMILEAAGPSFNPNTNVESDEPPNQDAKKFYDLLKATEKPLYEGCSRHTRFSAVSRLLNIKSEFNMSPPIIDSALQPQQSSDPPQISPEPDPNLQTNQTLDSARPLQVYSRRKVPPLTSEPVQSSSLEPQYVDVIDSSNSHTHYYDVPILRTCTNHPISSFLNFENLSTNHKAFLTNLHTIPIPNTLSEALQNEN
ncbi:uncharacterized protein G2W53_033359 [Senna tora]|uniref:Transposase-associated domain-containing protein n=1 Tax=Senna tora TaxID=362788 RepID=A0A834SZ29_9FABA|nr:uncharacterized protein G2W53_033359 [Senna tora]